MVLLPPAHLARSRCIYGRGVFDCKRFGSVCVGMSLCVFAGHLYGPVLCSFFPSVYATIGVNSASVYQPRDPMLPKQLLLCVERAAVRLLRMVFVKSPFLCAFSKG